MGKGQDHYLSENVTEMVIGKIRIKVTEVTEVTRLHRLQGELSKALN